jgi:hypothetical protein
MMHPNGPFFYRVVARRAVVARLIAACVVFVCAAVLGLASFLQPNPAGLGTHKQLGLPSCSAVVLSGYPCPTCGITTAFAHTVRGEFISAFAAHPGGLIFALATVVAFSVSLGVLFTGKVWTINWYRVSPARVSVLIVVVLLGGWGFKVVEGVLSGTLPITH